MAFYLKVMANRCKTGRYQNYNHGVQKVKSFSVSTTLKLFLKSYPKLREIQLIPNVYGFKQVLTKCNLISKVGSRNFFIPCFPLF